MGSGVAGQRSGPGCAAKFRAIPGGQSARHAGHDHGRGAALGGRRCRGLHAPRDGSDGEGIPAGSVELVPKPFEATCTAMRVRHRSRTQALIAARARPTANSRGYHDSAHEARPWKTLRRSKLGQQLTSQSRRQRHGRLREGPTVDAHGARSWPRSVHHGCTARCHRTKPHREVERQAASDGDSNARAVHRTEEAVRDAGDPQPHTYACATYASHPGGADLK